MKAILVIDMPSECGWECPCYRENNACEGMCTETLKSTLFTDESPSWCPLKPLPLPLLYEQTDTQTVKAVKIDNSFRLGWNACLEEIEK